MHKAGKLYEAQDKYDDALAVCQEYDLSYVACEIYYSFAKLHIEMRQFQTAFTECTVSLKIRPESKVYRTLHNVLKFMYVCITFHQMYYMRGKVLREALTAPFVSVPPELNFQMVISDYCESHRLKDSVKALTQAIIVAVDYRKLPSLSLYIYMCGESWLPTNSLHRTGA